MPFSQCKHFFSQQFALLWKNDYLCSINQLRANMEENRYTMHVDSKKLFVEKQIDDVETDDSHAINELYGIWNNDDYMPADKINSILKEERRFAE